jgi:CHAD domain-containing protein
VTARPLGKRARLRRADRGDLAALARRIVDHHYRRMRQFEAATRAGTDVEALHQMRVQTRRLRVLLRIFNGCLPEAAERVRAELKPIADALGAERDEDVLALHLESYLPLAVGDEARVLRGLVARRRSVKARAHRALVAKLRSRAYARFCADLEALVTSPGRDEGRAPKRFARRAVRRRLRRVRALVRGGALRSVEGLHELRVAVKRLRYAADALRELLPDRSRPILRQTAVLQELLGTVHDRDVALQLLARSQPVGRAVAWRRGAQALRERLGREREAAMGEVPGRLRRLLARKVEP